jgi:hypothetical protein
MQIDRFLPVYYAATAAFLLLDYAFGINVRIAFLDAMPLARALYYVACFACLAAIIWRPSWSAAVGTVESLVTLVALIFGMAVRILVPNDAIFAENAPFVTQQEIINFVISGSVAYYAWTTGLKRLRGG